MENQVPEPKEYWPFPWWENYIRKSPDPSWTNKPSHLKDVFFDPTAEHNLAREYGIDGLGPLLRKIDSAGNVRHVWALRDNDGFHYIFDESEGYVYGFKEKMSEAAFGWMLGGGFSFEYEIQKGRLIDADDPENPRFKMPALTAAAHSRPQQVSSGEENAAGRTAESGGRVEGLERAEDNVPKDLTRESS
ncbi:hypothetical protein H2198_007526 [Neophaeococcomyces mojaviensis]|uniref:Uncharacterized protein n=1 Tax=Neophaeococcomyces mojaviensis TaxID=3383035 RepID=A0ACC2ZZV8_9EURO|nr:hypothetical protein H2198_007526 [Knufia sp. JES_112]